MNDEPIQVDDRSRALSHLAFVRAAETGMSADNLQRLSAELERIDRIADEHERNQAGRELVAAVKRGDYG